MGHWVVFIIYPQDGKAVIFDSLRHTHKEAYMDFEYCLLLTFTNAPDLYTASARFVVAFPLEYSPKVYQSVDRQ